MKKVLSVFLMTLLCLMQQTMANFLGAVGKVRLNDNVAQAGANMYVLENGSIGLIIPKQTAFNPANPAQAFAPVQSVIYHDHVRSDNSANYIDCGRENITSVVVTPQIVSDYLVSVTYKYNYTINGVSKHYTSVIELSANTKSARILEEATTDVCWEVKFSDGLNPTKGRYRGWGNYISFSDPGLPVNGYELNNLGQQIAYRKWDAPNRGDAMLDLNFSESRNYRLQLWECGGNPAVGYYYQFFNPDSAIGNNRLFGLFHGRPSKLQGASVWGNHNFTNVMVYTRPGGVKYLKADKDANNHNHYTWVTRDDELYYAETDAAGAIVQQATSIANGVTNPSIYLQGNTPIIHAVGPGPNGGTIVRYKRVPGGTFSNENISLNTEPPALEPAFTRIPQAASNNLYEFLLVHGGLVNGERRLYLYRRALNGSGPFTLTSDFKTMSSYTQPTMPDMKSTPDGKVQILYTDASHVKIAVIQPSTMNFSHDQYVFNTDQWANLDPFIDRQTARSYTTRHNNLPAVWHPDGNGVICLGGTPENQQSYINMGMFENLPSNTSIAFDGVGNALMYNREKFYRYEATNGTNGTWVQLTGPLSIATKEAVVLYTNGSFRIAGVNNGELRQFNYTLGNADFSMTGPILFSGKNSAVVKSQLRMTDDGGNPKTLRRFEWCIYTGKQTTDLAPETAIQPIGIEMNHQSGLGNRVQGYYNVTPTVESNFEQAAIYSSSPEVQTIIQKVKNAQSSSYYDFLKDFDNYYRPIFDAWRDNSPSRTVGVTLARDLIAEMQGMVTNYRFGEGIYNSSYHYITGAKRFSLASITAACLLADNDIKSRLTGQEIVDLKRLVSFYGRIMWDEDNAPITHWNNETLHPGVGLSTENMPPLYSNIRSFFALLLQNDPDRGLAPDYIHNFYDRANAVEAQTNALIQASFNACGAPYGTPHYTQPANEPTFFTMLQLKALNVNPKDLFSSNYAKLKKHAQSLFALATPVNPRFSNIHDGKAYRKLVGFGDGQEGVSIAAGLLAAGIGSTDPTLRNQLLSSYFNGNYKFSANGPIWLVVDYEQSHNTPLPLGSANINEYVSHLRSGIYTPNESAAWLVNGKQYRDHRHDDAGQVLLYGLNTPISINWDGNNSVPQKNHGALKATVLPHSYFTDWDNTDPTQGQPVTDANSSNHTWPGNQTKEFGKFSNSSFATAEMKNQAQTATWDRTLRLISPRIDRPVFVIRDVIRNAGGTITNNAHIWSMPVMSDGNIQVTGIGTAQPYAQQLAPDNQFWQTDILNGPKPKPTATQTTPEAGLYRFNFIGTLWNKQAPNPEPAKGVDVNVYALTDAPVNYNASMWSTDFIETTERTEFNNATGRSFKQTQQFLRIKAGGEFFTVILPFNKGTDPYNNKVTQSAPGEIKVEFDNANLYVGKEYAFYDGGTIQKTFTTYSNTTYSNSTEGVLMAGGAAELTLEPQQVIVRVHGNSGQRQITIPQIGYVLQGSDNTVTTSNINNTGTQISINYVSAGNCVSPDEQGYKELVFVQDGLNNSVTIANSPICSGSALQLDVLPGVIGATYQWTGPNNFSSQLKNPVISNVTLAAAGTYNCVMTVGTTIVNLPPVTVVVNPTPIPVTLSYNNPICVGGNLTISASPAGNSNTTYQWTGPSGPLANNTHSLLISNVNNTQAGVYTCQYTEGGCTNSIASITVTILPSGSCGGGGGSSTDRVSLNNHPATEAGVAIYPNPTSGTVSIQLGKRMTNATVELLTVEGKKVYSHRLAAVKGTANIHLPSHLRSGTYVMRITHSSGLISRRLILQRK